MSAQPGLSLGELAVRFGCILKGDPDLRVSRVAALERADASSVAFLANPRYRRHLQQTQAGVVVIDPKLADACPVNALLAKNPYATYARIAALLYPPPAAPPGRHATAAVEDSAQIDASASIGPHAVIGARVKIGARTVIGPGCVVMDDVTIGADTRLTANVTLCHGVSIGDRCLFHPSVVIGADGFGLAPDQGEWLKVPQVGTVRIGNDVEIGASTTIDRGAMDDTVIGDGVKMDNQIQIGHNVRIGDHTAIAGCAGISGSAVIGKRCMIGGMVGVAGHLTICDDVMVTGKSFVNSSIRKPGYYSSGIPVDETTRFRKNAARFHHLDEFVREVRRERGAADQAAPPETEE
ncbi:UDP-3-O-(3-hydroxymyristoyl)glucosamine N-acyltransferase [Steroidobacter cummioxidans]|uniref:UDP-3-O-(3-hydroxymyristoyl)glucosamine N-acyltransferase n=1 Tax=Steroidobacter cummioxidans TaxID=1803913 RepID=UPI000E319138|nr:UDP-3-O-(3-hydroxymyristoyl)glucosamine N-acyltransferase [Steroidobacter cummioxidans]